LCKIKKECYCSDYGAGEKSSLKFSASFTLDAYNTEVQLLIPGLGIYENEIPSPGNAHGGQQNVDLSKPKH
jgi:hypothetical protein